MRKLIQILFFLPLIILSSCFVDIPSTRPEGPSIIIYGKVTDTSSGTPISKAVISDGFTTTLTNNFGEYRFKSYPGANHVFISVPESYEIPLNNGMPQIFQFFDNSKDSVKVNFQLTPLKNGVEKEFTLIAVADPQVHNANHLRRLNNETISDIIKESDDYKNVYGLTLGDIVFDSLAILDDVKQSFISTNIPFFHTIGNHDFSTAFYDPAVGSEEFVSTFGPLDYSFNRGEAHIVVLNNVYNYGVTPHNYGFAEEQLKWLKSDLEHVPKSKMLIVSVHVPIFPSTTMERKEQFLEIISGFNEVHILSGHQHANSNIINAEYKIHEHITGAASGMWWIRVVNSCGTPNGYGVYEISGNKMKNWYYKSVNQDRSYQIRLLAPNTFGDKEGYVIANVWNADEKWKIELYEDGINRGQMERFTDYAPEVYTLNKIQKIDENTSSYRKTSHLYRLKPTKSDAVFMIKVTDQFGNIYQKSIPHKGVDSLVKYI